MSSPHDANVTAATTATLNPPSDRTSPEPTRFLPWESAGTRSVTLPPDLRLQATRRLRWTAFSYALAFFLADFVPTVITGGLPERTAHLERWLPTVLSIAMGVAVGVVAGNPRLSWEWRLHLGLLFEVAGSYGVALAQYVWLPNVAQDRHLLHSLSPSWVAVWATFFSIVVPAPPLRAFLAAAASMSAPPVVIGVVLRQAGLGRMLSPGEFFFSHVFPYLVCLMLASVGSRVVHRLGRDLSRARELGSYRLIERLGRGGMGEVWKASHRLLARPAAVKFIRADSFAGVTGEEQQVLLQRFEREARATASLTSPHTVSLYDFGVTEDGVFYSVMELLDGVDLDDLVRRFGPVGPARAVHLLSQVCESLDEAHTRSLIHRDVKPANLFTCRSGTRCDFVKVLDFGLVVRNRTVSDLETRLTLPDHAAGTPAYMPPEVARGEEIDGRADLYAVGCVAYWLLTGRPVFEGKSPYEIVSRHLSATPEPPSQVAAERVPRELDELILRCLEKIPARRPATARELERQLRAVPLPHRWGDEDAEAWWAAHLPAGATDGAGAGAVTPL